MDTIIASSITSLIALIICLINNSHQMKQFDKKYSQDQENMRNTATEKQRQVIEELHSEITEVKNNLELVAYKVDELSTKQDKYNHLQERTLNLEGKCELVLEKIAVANNRIADLENHEAEIIKGMKGEG